MATGMLDEGIIAAATRTPGATIRETGTAAVRTVVVGMAAGQIGIPVAEVTIRVPETMDRVTTTQAGQTLGAIRADGITAIRRLNTEKSLLLPRAAAHPAIPATSIAVRSSRSEDPGHRAAAWGRRASDPAAAPGVALPAQRPGAGRVVRREARPCHQAVLPTARAMGVGIAESDSARGSSAPF